jgi:predicted Zn-dependent protease
MMTSRVSAIAVGKLVGKVLLLIITIVVVRACLPETTKIHVDEASSVVNRKLILIPTDGIPSIFLANMRKQLEQQHKFGVLVTVQMGLPADAKMPGSEQFDVDKIALAGFDVCKNMSVNNEYCVVLTNRDINNKDSGLRFVFAQHYQGISVVSVARLSEMNFGGKLNLATVPIIFENISNRALKLVNKAIGLGYYKYPLSSDRSSVMFAPIMSLSDLDSVGGWYSGSQSGW